MNTSGQTEMTAGSPKKYLFDNDFGMDDGAPLRAKPAQSFDLTDDDEESDEAKDAREAAAAAAIAAEAPPPPPTFSEQDLERARQEGHQAGRDDATRDLASALEQRLADTMKTINSQLIALYDAFEQDKETNSSNAVAVAAIMVRKLFPAMNMDKAMAEIEHMIVEAMKRTSGSPALIIRVPQDMHSDVAAKAKELAALRGREGTLNVIADETLAMGDVSVQWEGGGMARDTRFIWQEIDEIIERNLGRKLETFEPDEPAENLASEPNLEPISGQKSEQLVVNPAKVGENEEASSESRPSGDVNDESHGLNPLPGPESDPARDDADDEPNT